ncbi:Major facilitator superfamily protein isoform 1 [Hibiscus syriacus]|uniref:Major facilitator superfamily protein isoform 1 n=1 Tax=Hibiscus syriacus TaxID=106335 RepID=A0A6A3AYC6_HIBSY|nr:Major facilitator superfamily protein isoform 1 [Hibiscus syriacus]
MDHAAPQTTVITTRSTVRKLRESPSVSSKIPFQSRKIRKLASPTTVHDPVKSPHQPSLVKIPKSLTTKPEIDVALNHLRTSDPLLATLISTHPPPKLSPCNSASSPFPNPSSSNNSPPKRPARSTPLRFALREIGVSARKASYLHDLSDNFSTGFLSDTSIITMDDETLFQSLTSVKGIGPWSVHMFMIFSLHRPDVLPVGDLGVRKGVQSLYGLKELPKPLQMEQICEKWRPFRSVGSWYMWRLLEDKTKGNGKVEDDQSGGF